jgi:hypothetical protein
MKTAIIAALVSALAAPAMAGTITDDLTMEARGAALFQTYARQCKEQDFPKLTADARLEVMQTLAQFSSLARDDTSKADERLDHVKFCRLAATVIPVSGLIPVPLMSHNIAPTCTPDNIVGDETPAQCAKAEKAAHDEVAAQWSQLPRAMQFACVDGAGSGEYDDHFWRESADCLRDTPVADATQRWINHTVKGEYE